jgi:hypothetical protein
LSLKSSVVASLPLKYKEVLQSPRWRTHHVLNHSKQTKNEKDMGQELGTGLEQLSLILFLVFSNVRGDGGMGCWVPSGDAFSQRNWNLMEKYFSSTIHHP